MPRPVAADQTSRTPAGGSLGAMLSVLGISIAGWGLVGFAVYALVRWA